MNNRMTRLLSLTAISGLFFLGGTGTALAAHDSKAHDEHHALIAQEEWPGDGWDHMINNPSDMTGMMCSPPMHQAEHPGPNDQPDVVEAVQTGDTSECFGPDEGDS